MKVVKRRRFKDDIRKTFIIYALIPVILITTFSFFFSFFILYRTIVKQNADINSTVSGGIEKAVSAYTNKITQLSNDAVILKAIQTGSAGTEIYEEIYGFVNRIGIKSNFYVFDKNMNSVIESNLARPEYAARDHVFDFGITGRMHDNPDAVIVERVASVDNTKRTLTIGKAVSIHNKVVGYITFDLDNDELSRIISQNYSTTVVITDKNDYVIARNNVFMENKFGKIDENVRNASGFTKSMDDSNYITKNLILSGTVCIYTITSIGYIGSIFVIVGIILILLYVVLIITTFISSGKIASRKTKAIDEIIDAMGQVQLGNLDHMLDVKTNDEFQIISQSYNKMLVDIKNLIELNKEKAKENVVSEIQQLESQFNPHFLFNTLETIKYMCRIEPESVNKIIIGLSQILRYSIDNAISEVTLDKDIEYTENYLMIQKYRFGSRFSYSIEVQKEVHDCIVPKLILQPIIENAIKYGYDSIDCMEVVIRAEAEEDKLVIAISDNGTGMDMEQLQNIRRILKMDKNKSSHIGLHNVNRRIQLMYGNNENSDVDRFGIRIDSSVDKGTVVEIILPINRSGEFNA